MARRTEQKPGYAHALDGLRAICALGVMAYHMGFRWMGGGFHGVTVLFVLSGYLATAGLLRDFRRGRGHLDLAGYWLRRVRRLYPTVVVYLVATAAACTLFNHVMLTKMRPDILPASLMFINWAKIFRAESYFAQAGSPSPLTHFWTLAIEWQFFLVWPPVLYLLLRRRTKKRALQVGLLVLSLASALLMGLLYTPGADPSRAYYGTDTRLFSLLLGCFLALFWPFDKVVGRRVDQLPEAYRNVVGALGFVALVGLVVIMVVTNGYSAFSYWGGTLLVSLLAMAVIAACVPRDTFVAQALAARPLTWVGERSYAIYLWHYPVIELLTQRNAAVPTPWWRYALMLLATLALSELSYRFVETPLRGRGLLEALGLEGLRRQRHEEPALAQQVVPEVVRHEAAEVRAGASEARDQVVRGPSEAPEQNGDEADEAAQHAGSEGAEAPEAEASAPAAGEAPDAPPASAEPHDHAPDGAPSPVQDEPGRQAPRWTRPDDLGRRKPRSAGGRVPGGRAGSKRPAAARPSAPTRRRSAAGRPVFGAGRLLASAALLVLTIIAVVGLVSVPAVNALGDAEGEARVSKASLRKPLVDGVYDVVFIGDSVSLGANEQLTAAFPHGVVNSEGSRQADAALEVLKGYLDQGVVGDTVVMHVGTNGILDDDIMDAMVEAVGPGRTLWLVNDQLPDSDTRREPNNACIQRCVDKYDNVNLIDWYGASLGHSDWLEYDGIHLTWEGRDAYGALVPETMGYEPPTDENTKFDVTLLGDVTALSASDELAAAFPHGAIDCAEGRDPAKLAEVYRGYANDGLVGEHVVLCVGADEPLSEGALDKLLAAIGDEHKVWLVNGRSTASWVEETNRLLASAADAHNNVTLVDWHAVSDGQPEWFDEESEGVLLTADGSAAYAQTIVGAMGYDASAYEAEEADAEADAEADGEADADAAGAEAV